MTLIYNATFDKNTRKLAFEDKAGNEIYSFTVPERAPSVDDITKPLTFKATQDGSTVTLSSYNTVNGAFQTSLDGGNTWVDYTLDSAITLNIGDEVSFRAKSDRTSKDYSGVYFKMTGKIEAWHNVMSMLRTSDFATYESMMKHAFLNLFKGCTSLTKAPVLPATTLAEDCYSNMFDGCTSLTEAPVLPATTRDMFCYWQMFKGCTSLTKSPELPATTLRSRCYEGMFEGCSRLNEVHCKIPSTISEGDISSYTYNWLSNVSETGTFYTNADANWPSGASGIPTSWTRVNERAKDDLSKPLTFKATQGGSTVKLAKYGSPSGAFQTSTDGGNTWTDYTNDTAITLNTGDEVSFRAKNDRTTDQNGQNYFYFEMTGKIEAWHNVMSMIRTNDFATYKSAVDYAFAKMFSNCMSLTKAPALPATTLADSCYWAMFLNCSSLTEAPELPATTLAVDCYYDMFSECQSLTKAPELPATTLANRCYNTMFFGCFKLNEVHCNMPSSYSSSDVASYATDWLSNVSSTGTFYTNADANWPSGASGIPEGWTRVNEAVPTVDDITKPLTFRATQDGSTVKLVEYNNSGGSFYGSFKTSRDGGNTWEDYTEGTAITLNIGDEVSFRSMFDRNSKEFYQSYNKYFYFKMTGKIEALHNVMSMYRAEDFATRNYIVEPYAFHAMFKDCTSLTKAPALPSTSLYDHCYSNMFTGCTSLTEAPDLPATSLHQACYQSMFWGCTSLRKTPELTATTLDKSCYHGMFSGCSSLNEVHCQIPSSYSASDIQLYTGNTSTQGWLYGVSSTGTFYTNADANWPSGANGIPENWSRVNI